LSLHKSQSYYLFEIKRFGMTSTTLDELDSLLEEYLSLVDNYQSLQLSLESCLKSAYFNLAKSKIALGPHRLSQKGWDLKQKDSFVQV